MKEVLPIGIENFRDMTERFHSNPEAGDGYADIAFASGTRTDRTGVVIELKYCRKSEDLYDGADAGLQQIKEKRYTEILDKWRCTKQCVYGIAFCRKDCAVSGGFWEV